MKILLKFLKILLILLVICTGIVFYAFKIEPNLLVVEEITLEISENPENEMKIVLFSDTHFKSDTSESYTAKIIDRINEQDADVVMFLGDLIDNQSENPIDIEYVTEKLGQITGEKLAIMGNHDYGGGAERTYKSILENSGFNLLINDVVTINDVKIVGLDDMIFGTPDYEILGEIQEDDSVLVMLHEGDMIEHLDPKYDMAFSGHSHGGQIAIPFVKELVVPTGSKMFINGLYEDDNIFVTSGIGTTFINARLFCLPEIVVVTLKY